MQMLSSREVQQNTATALINKYFDIFTKGGRWVFKAGCRGQGSITCHNSVADEHFKSNFSSACLRDKHKLLRERH